MESFRITQKGCRSLEKPVARAGRGLDTWSPQLSLLPAQKWGLWAGCFPRPLPTLCSLIPGPLFHLSRSAGALIAPICFLLLETKPRRFGTSV